MDPSDRRMYALTQPVCGQQVGNYVLLRELASGGYAHVYQARHRYLNHFAALKLLTGPVSSDEELMRFRYEGRLLASLRHQHIVRALDFGWGRATPYLAMEYASGGSLAQVFPHNTSLPLTTILSLILPIAAALQYLHHRGVVHCDVKPGNILLGSGNEVWVGDFGIATTLTAQHLRTEPYRGGKVLGTPHYLAPEQARGNPLPASDQYALAVMVHEWLRGRPLFEGTALEICYQHLSSPPPPLRESIPSIPRAVERAVLKALAKDPRQRFAHVQEFASALEQASHSGGKRFAPRSLLAGILSTGPTQHETMPTGWFRKLAEG